MSNKPERDSKEMYNVFGDPKYSRQAWRAVGNAILQNPCSKLGPQYDKDGNKTLQSQIDSYTYEKLKKDIENISEKDRHNREPTELEMIMAGQIVKARWDTSAAVFVRDTLGAKPVDESKVDTTVNNFESLTDEELEVLAAFRASKTSKTGESNE